MVSSVHHKNTPPIHHHTPTSQPDKLSRFLKALRKVSNDICTRFVDLFCGCFSKPKPGKENTTSKTTQDDSQPLNNQGNFNDEEKTGSTENGLSASSDVTSASPKQQNLSETPFILTENIKPKQTFHPDFTLQGSKLEELYPSGYIYDEPPIILDVFSKIEYKNSLNSLNKAYLSGMSRSKLCRQNVSNIVKSCGGEVIEQISHCSEKLFALMKIYKNSEGVCHGLSIRQLLAFSKGKTIDEDMLIDPDNKESGLKISEWNEIYTAQNSSNNCAISSLEYGEELVQKYNFVKVSRLFQESTREKILFCGNISGSIPTRSEAIENSVDHMIDAANKNKDKNVLVLFGSSTNMTNFDNTAGHSTSIMIEKSQGNEKIKIKLYDPGLPDLQVFNQVADFKSFLKKLYCVDTKDPSIFYPYSKCMDFATICYIPPAY